MSQQVDKTHYDQSHYDTRSRFVGYFNQKEAVANIAAASGKKQLSILEIGPGGGLLTNYLRAQGHRVDTVDIAADLNPTFIGDIRNLTAVVKDKYDLIVCFEVLEHIPFDDVKKALTSFSKITNGPLLVSIPQIKLYVSLWLKMSKLNAAKFYLGLPFPKTHTFDGQHYWELGTKGYSNAIVTKEFNCHFNIKSTFIDPLDPYHKFFVMDLKRE